MNKLQVIIERAEDNYSAYIEGVDGVVATGESIDEIKTNMLEAIGIFVEECREFGCEVPDALQGEYEVNFKMDVSTLMAFYSGIFSKAGLERLTGINQKQLWHYANGSSRPRPEQRQRIESALHQLGHELISVAL